MGVVISEVILEQTPKKVRRGIPERIIWRISEKNTWGISEIAFGKIPVEVSEFEEKFLK